MPFTGLESGYITFYRDKKKAFFFSLILSSRELARVGSHKLQKQHKKRHRLDIVRVWIYGLCTQTNTRTHTICQYEIVDFSASGILFFFIFTNTSWKEAAQKGREGYVVIAKSTLLRAYRDILLL